MVKSKINLKKRNELNKLGKDISNLNKLDNSNDSYDNSSSFNTENAEKYMKLAIELAQQGEGYVNTNPLVGAVIVKNGEIVGKGYHEYYGGNHAEVNALNEAGKKAKESDVYVTLEPCSHYGKTPPCVDRLIEAGIKRCIIALVDPNPLVAGKGIEKLKENGIEVEVGVLSEEAYEQNRIFFKYIKTKLPYIFLKCGITLDGKIATRSGDSKWITNVLAREKVQRLRNRFMGILVGENTYINDNPRLTSRKENSIDPYRILVLPNLHKMIKDNFEYITASNAIRQSIADNKTIIVTDELILGSKEKNKIDELKIKYNVRFIYLKGKSYSLKEIITRVGELKIDSVLIEGGGLIISQAFKEDIIDEGEIFIAPKILGDSNAVPFISGFLPTTISDSINLKNVSFNIYNDNVSLSFKK